MTEATDRARDLLTRTPLVDGHNDLLWELRRRVGYDLDRLDVGQPQPALDTDIPRLRAGGVGAQFWSVYVPADTGGTAGDAAVAATLEQIDAAHTLIARYSDTFRLACTADDVTAAFADGRIASLLGMEGGHSIACSLGVLRAMYALGVRYLTLTHTANVPWADAATDEPAVGGLTAFGEAVVGEMNRLGMLVDLSHVSPDTMRAALKVTEAPLIFSHSSARAICDHPRNVPDDVLAQLPANGGVAMVTFVAPFVSADFAAWADEATAAGVLPHSGEIDEAALRNWTARHPAPPVTIADVADHVEHVREVAGVAHVGLGGDFDGTRFLPQGLEDVSRYPALLAELAGRGWSEADLAALAGGNVLRVLRGAEAVARALRASRGPSLVTIADVDHPGGR